MLCHIQTTAQGCVRPSPSFWNMISPSKTLHDWNCYTNNLTLFACSTEQSMKFIPLINIKNAKNHAFWNFCWDKFSNQFCWQKVWWFFSGYSKPKKKSVFQSLGQETFLKQTPAQVEAPPTGDLASHTEINHIFCLECHAHSEGSAQAGMRLVWSQ